MKEPIGADSGRARGGKLEGKKERAAAHRLLGTRLLGEAPHPLQPRRQGRSGRCRARQQESNCRRNALQGGESGRVRYLDTMRGRIIPMRAPIETPLHQTLKAEWIPSCYK